MSKLVDNACLWWKKLFFFHFPIFGYLPVKNRHLRHLLLLFLYSHRARTIIFDFLGNVRKASASCFLSTCTKQIHVSKHLVHMYSIDYSRRKIENSFEKKKMQKMLKSVWGKQSLAAKAKYFAVYIQFCCGAPRLRGDTSFVKQLEGNTSEGVGHTPNL